MAVLYQAIEHKGIINVPSGLTEDTGRNFRFKQTDIFRDTLLGGGARGVGGGEPTGKVMNEALREHLQGNNEVISIYDDYQMDWYASIVLWRKRDVDHDNIQYIDFPLAENASGLRSKLACVKWPLIDIPFVFPDYVNSEADYHAKLKESMARIIANPERIMEGNIKMAIQYGNPDGLHEAYQRFLNIAYGNIDKLTEPAADAGNDERIHNWIYSTMQHEMGVVRMPHFTGAPFVQTRANLRNSRKGNSVLSAGLSSIKTVSGADTSKDGSDASGKSLPSSTAGGATGDEVLSLGLVVKKDDMSKSQLDMCQSIANLNILSKAANNIDTLGTHSLYNIVGFLSKSAFIMICHNQRLQWGHIRLQFGLISYKEHQFAMYRHFFECNAGDVPLMTKCISYVMQEQYGIQINYSRPLGATRVGATKVASHIVKRIGESAESYVLCYPPERGFTKFMMNIPASYILSRAPAECDLRASILIEDNKLNNIVFRSRNVLSDAQWITILSKKLEGNNLMMRKEITLFLVAIRAVCEAYLKQRCNIARNGTLPLTRNGHFDADGIRNKIKNYNQRSNRKGREHEPKYDRVVKWALEHIEPSRVLDMVELEKIHLSNRENDKLEDQRIFVQTNPAGEQLYLRWDDDFDVVKYGATMPYFNDHSRQKICYYTEYIRFEDVPDPIYAMLRHEFIERKLGIRSSLKVEDTWTYALNYIKDIQMQIGEYERTLPSADTVDVMGEAAKARNRRKAAGDVEGGLNIYKKTESSFEAGARIPVKTKENDVADVSLGPAFKKDTPAELAKKLENV